MALNCGPNWFKGMGTQTQKITAAGPGVAIAIAQSLALTKAWAAMMEDHDQDCPNGCNKKSAVVGLHYEYKVANNEISYRVIYILRVLCDKTGTNYKVPSVTEFDRLEREYERRFKRRR